MGRLRNRVVTRQCRHVGAYDRVTITAMRTTSTC